LLATAAVEEATNVIIPIAEKTTQLGKSYKVIKPVFQHVEEPFPKNLFTIDCSGRDMDLGPQENKDVVQEMKKVYNDTGLVYLVNTGMTDLQKMRKWAQVIVEKQIEYKGGANPRKAIEPNVYDVGAPNEAWLHYHHEMAYVGKSPKAISLFCKHCPEGKGYTYVSDSMQATDDILSTPFGQKLKEKNICYVRNLTDKEYYKNKDQSMIYNHWQDSFGVEDPDLVEPLAAERGLKVEWEIRGKNRFLKTKYYVSAFEYFPQIDRNVLYSSVADDFMWFDSWPGIDITPIDDRPLRLTFGDDTDMTQEEKQQFVDVYDKYGFPAKWKTGEVMAMCNYRWAHGRPGFTLQPGEKRKLGVLLGETFDRVGHVDGKW
jgi:hypothetical protein